MGAGPTPGQVKYAKQKALRQAVEVFKTEPWAVKGNGIRFSAEVQGPLFVQKRTFEGYLEVLRASNGEACLLYVLRDVNAGRTYGEVGGWRAVASRAGIRLEGDK